MDLAISTMSAMTFSWGFVHCDPHPGNILVRPHPTKKGKPQIVRAEAGLAEGRSSSTTGCISTYRKSSARNIAPSGDPSSCSTCQRSSRSLVDGASPWTPTCARVFNRADPRFASAILLRPFQVNKRRRKDDAPPEPEKSEYEQQVELKRRLKTMLENEQLIPRVRLHHGPSLSAGTDLSHAVSADDAGKQPAARVAVVARQPHGQVGVQGVCELVDGLEVVGDCRTLELAPG